MSSIVIQGDTSGSITVEAPSVAGTHTLTLPKATGNIATDATVGLGQKNLIINGDMRIAQRSTNATGITGNGYFGLDRWQVLLTSMGTWTMSQDSDVPSGQGFSNSLKMACTTADASPASGDRIFVRQFIEAQNLQHLAFGTSAAKSLTYSFWIKSNKTGTYTLVFYTNDPNRAYTTTFTISSSDTWEKKIVTISGDTVGAINNDNGQGLAVYWTFGAGSDWNSGSVTNAWQTSSNTNYSAGTTVNLADSTSNYVNITGAQLEVGENATPFENRMYGTELALCQRYAYKLGGEISSYYADSAGGYWDANYIGFGKIRFPVSMRTAPSATFTTGGGINVWRGNTTYTGFSWNITVSGNPTTRDCFIVGNKTSHGVTVDAGAMIKFEDTAANCLFSAEL